MTETTPSSDHGHEPTEKQKAASAYNNAMKRLRDAHLDEFNTYRVEESAKVGITWKPKPSPSKKAEQDMEALLTAHPELVDVFAERLANRVQK
jgi:hypothetical protein